MLNRQVAVLCLMLGMTVAGGVSAADSAAGAASVMTLEEAHRLLDDHSYFNSRKSAGSIADAAQARAVLNEIKEAKALNQKAAAVASGACSSKFLVNNCLEGVRRKAYQREREFEQVRIEADAVIRADRTRDIREKQAENKKNGHAPMKLSNKKAAAPQNGASVEEAVRQRLEAERANEAAYEAKQRDAQKRASEVKAPVALPGARVKDASKPADRHVGSSASDVQAKQEKAEQKRAQEAANEAVYAQKQAEAAERARHAEAEAAKRRADREARNKRFDQSMKERTEAQKRYEAEQDKQESGLSRFF